MASDVEAILKRIEAGPGVIGMLVVDEQGKVIRTTMDRQATQLYASEFCHLGEYAYHVVRDLDPQNDLQVLRIKTNDHEVFMAPDKGYTLVVVQANQALQS